MKMRHTATPAHKRRCALSCPFYGVACRRALTWCSKGTTMNNTGRGENMALAANKTKIVGMIGPVAASPDMDKRGTHEY